MLTATLPTPQVAATESTDRQESFVSDAEISRRVLSIRSGWTVAERMARRREAERRFADLMDKLSAA